MRISLKHWLRRRREPWTIVFYEAFKRWKRDRMEEKRMLFQNLGPSSVVLDFGGFEGNWAANIIARYGSIVHVFEPHPAFANKIARRFAKNDAIKVHDFALGSSEGFLRLSDDGDSSSSFRTTQSGVEGRIRAVSDFFSETQIELISVAKVNIEGGEYDLLPALIEAGVITRIECLQVQFHLFSPNEIPLRDAIRQRLSASHTCDWNYDFVWEQWTLKA